MIELRLQDSLGYTLWCEVWNCDRTVNDVANRVRLALAFGLRGVL